MLYTVEFEVPVSGAYLTIHGSSNAGGRNSWIHLDAVSLVRVPAADAVAVLATACLAGIRRRR